MRNFLSAMPAILKIHTEENIREHGYDVVIGNRQIDVMTRLCYESSSNCLAEKGVGAINRPVFQIKAQVIDAQFLI